MRKTWTAVVWIALANLLVLLVATPEARSDVSNAPNNGTLSKAKQNFDRGMELLEDGRFAEAAAKFEVSLSLAPRASTAFNLAVALRGTGDVVGATKRLEELLVAKHGALSSEQEEQARALLQKVRGETATLTIRVKGPPGATVRLDGTALSKKRSNIQTIKVNPGRHRMTAFAPDHQAPDRTINLQPGARESVVLVLKRKVDRRNGKLRIVSKDEEAWITVKGVKHKRRSPWVKSLKPGTYTVRVIGSSGSSESKVTVVAGRLVSVSLDPPPSSSFFSSPWFWVGVGAVAIAGGTTAAIVLTREKEEPVSDPVWGVISALEF